MDTRINQQSLGSTLKKCIYFLFNKKKIATSSLILMIIITGITPSIDSIFLQNITDSIEFYSDQDLDKTDLISIMFKWIIIYALWWESLNILWRIYDYAYLKIMPEIKSHVIDEIYNYIQYHDHEFFQKTLAGDIANRITESARSLEMIFAHASEKILRRLSVLLFALITLYMVHSVVAFIFFIWLILFVGISLFFAKTVNNYSTIYGKDKALVSGKIVDSIANISAIRMFNAYNNERKHLKTYLDMAVKSDQNMQWFMFKLRYALGSSCTLMIAAMIYYIITLRGNLEISIGQCILIITLCVSVISDVWDLTQAFGDLFEQIGSFHQSMTLLKKHGMPDHSDSGTLIVKTPLIEFRNVTFIFRDNNNKFDNQSITLKPYEKIALIGFSGSGKTTFANIISRLYDVEQGAVLIDGQDIKKVSQDSLRQNISIIPQEPILFHRSILENIKYGNMNASDEEVYKAAQSAHIHKFIMQLPDKYNTICGERGNNFSGGQRQRIIIARAFLKQAPILILDEATSALDNYTETLIHESLEQLMKNKTVLIIAHRFSTLPKMDRILVFDQGHIVEDGNHSELYKDGTFYKTLCKNAY